MNAQGYPDSNSAIFIYSDGSYFEGQVKNGKPNGFGKLAGYTQVEELGNLETPIILTNTLNVPTAADALIDYTLSQTQHHPAILYILQALEHRNKLKVRARHFFFFYHFY